jgi:hypothetical protein
MLPLPFPQKGGDLAKLKDFVNIHPDDWPLFVGGLLGCLLPEGTYPAISLIGGDGRCKSCLAVAILLLIDPNKVKGCGAPDSNEDLVLAARQHYLVVFDNLAEIQPWLSDGLCRLATGASYERRTKYKDSDTSAFTVKRPVVLTSIRDIIKAADLDSRTLKFDLPPIATRKTESILWADFEKERPKILGALYDAVSCGLRNLPNTKANLPRLADFGLWCKACEPALSLFEGTEIDSAAFVSEGNTAEDKKSLILEKYQEAREASVNETLGTDFATKIIRLAKSGFTGTGKELAKILELPTGDKEVKQMVGELRSLQTSLEFKNVSVEFRAKSHGKKLISIATR